MSSLAIKAAEKIDETYIQKILEELVKIDTQNPPGNTDRAAQYLKDELNALGLSPRIIPTAMPGQNCVQVSYGRTENRNCVIAGHLDTVPIGDPNQWKYPPHSAKVVNGVLYGRGSADMKAGIAAAIGCLSALVQQDNLELVYKIIFIATSDEEITMLGAKAFAETPLLDETDFLIIPEPTSLQCGICEKAVYWVHVTTHGKAAHGSMPHLGVSAIEAACRSIKAARAILPKEEHPLLGTSTFNCGTIQGGTKTNVVPDCCQMDWDFRLVPNTDASKFKNDLDQALKKEPKATIEYTIGQEYPALQTDPTHPYIESLLHWSAFYHKDPNKKSPIGLSYGTDAAMLLSYPQKRDIPFTIIGPGQADLAHVINEHVHLNEVFLAAKIYTSSIVDLFSRK